MSTWSPLQRVRRSASRRCRASCSWPGRQAAGAGHHPVPRDAAAVPGHDRADLAGRVAAGALGQRVGDRAVRHDPALGDALDQREHLFDVLLRVSPGATIWDLDAGSASRAGAQNGRVREAVTGARRIVVKVGSSSLTTAAGGIDEQRVDALVDVLGSLADRRARGGAGVQRRDRRRARPAQPAPASARPGHPAGRGQRRAGPADRAVRGRLRPARPAPSARCCSPSTT